MTEDFIDRVRRGVRRRRVRRAAATGGSLLATAAVTGAIVIGVNAAGRTSGGQGMPAGPATPASVATQRVSEQIEGVVFRYLPDGARRDGRDSFYTAAVGPDGLRNDGPAPSIGQPCVVVAMRRFTVAPANLSMFVTVLRPQRGFDSATSPDEMGAWLLKGAGVDNRAESFTVPSGRAYLITYRGTEVTTTTLVVAASAGVVVVVEAQAGLSVDELRRIAHGVSL